MCNTTEIHLLSWIFLLIYPLFNPAYANADSDAPLQKNMCATLHTQPPFRVLIDVRSNHSDGDHDFNTLVRLAKERHIDALAFTEHDRFTIRLGIDPIPHILGYSQEHPSLFATGLNQFFRDLNMAQQQHTMTLFAGTESTVGYHWQGIPFINLSLNHAEQHLITLGAKQASQIEDLSSYTLTHAYGNKILSLIFWLILTLLITFLLCRKKKIKLALLFTCTAAILIATWLTKATPNPSADFIYSAHQQDLFVIWAHPGTRSGVREGPMGVLLNTPPYNTLVFQTPADAFAAVYGDTDQNTQAGGLWDEYMMSYMQSAQHKQTKKPIWAVAAGDYHGEGQAGEFLGNFPMDVWAKSANPDDILDALKHGKMVAWQMQKHQNIAVKTLSLTYMDKHTHQSKLLLAGDKAQVPAHVTLSIALHELGDVDDYTTLKGQWVVDGEIAAQAILSTDPNKATHTIPILLSVGAHVIRFQILAQHGIRMESNPFLVYVSPQDMF